MHTRTAPESIIGQDQHALADSLALSGVIVGRVLGGESLTHAMSGLRATGSLRSAVQDLAFSTLRDFGRCNALVAMLTARPPAQSLRGLLMVALLDLCNRPKTEHAVVHQAVEAAGRVAPKGGAGAKGLVNAVLRNFIRQRHDLLARASATEEGHHHHPAWWLGRLRRAWPDSWETIVDAGNEEPGMTLRVNTRRLDAAAYLSKLQAAGIRAQLLGAQAIRLSQPLPVDQLPGFRQGEVSVQDWGAQQAAFLLAPEKGMRVLDACSAPGGKAAHLAECFDCELVCADDDAVRLQKVRDNLCRLGLKAQTVVADMRQSNPALGRFNRILADVPCTASGVVRRHPDIKWLRRESDIAKFAAGQSAMLDALWGMLKAGGRLLYATCSVFPEENRLQVQAFLERRGDASLIALPSLPGELGLADGQILPGEHSDGFYYALLEKRS